MRENVLTSIKQDYRRLVLSLCCDVIGDVINMKILFCRLFAYALSISDVRLRVSFEICKIWNFQNWRNFEVLGNVFDGSTTGVWICYINSEKHYLHFEFSINALDQILTELWQLENLTLKFFTLEPNYLTFDLHNKCVLTLTKTHIWVKFGNDWSNSATCIQLTTFIWTDKKQTDRQTVRRTYLPKLKILASNDRAIGDCVLAQIPK